MVIVMSLYIAKRSFEDCVSARLKGEGEEACIACAVGRVFEM